MSQGEHQKQVPDLRKYYCRATSRHYWILGYFGGAISVVRAYRLAEEYCEETREKMDNVRVEEILNSRRFQSMKVLYSVAPAAFQCRGIAEVEDFWKFAND